VPDLRGRVPIHQGQGSGLSNYTIGQIGGAETVTLTLSQIPAHAHPGTGRPEGAFDCPGAFDGPATATDPVGRVFAIPTDGSNAYSTIAPAATGGSGTLTPQGGNGSHDNMQPYQCVTFVISLFGIFPSPF